MVVPSSIATLLNDHEKSRGETGDARILTFSGVNGQDVYNPSAPFIYDGSVYMAARVESRDTEQSKVEFFYKENGVWRLDPTMPTFDLQDPHLARIGDEVVLTGVEAYFVSSTQSRYRTVFYRGPDIQNLKKFAYGPPQMKDIVPVELHDGLPGILTKHDGNGRGKGSVGFIILDSLDALTDETILLDADSIDLNLSDEESSDDSNGVFEAPNAAYRLAFPELGILAHIAYTQPNGHLEDEVKRYFGGTLIYNYLTGEASPVKIIATRSDFPEGVSKTPGITDDVVFPSGLVRKNGVADFYASLSDAQEGVKPIPDPFLNIIQQRQQSL